MKNMMALLTSVAFVFSSTKIFAAGISFSIEDKDLSKASAFDVDLIELDKSFLPFKDLDCSLVEKNIPLTEKRGVMTGLVTTEDGCGWGASIAPIWIIKKYLGKGSIAIYTGGYYIKIFQKVRSGMHDFSVNSDHSSVEYRFDGKKYIPAK